MVKLGERDVLTETQTGEIDDLLVDVVRATTGQGHKADDPSCSALHPP